MEDFRGAPGSFEALGRDAQSCSSPHNGGFGAAKVITIEVGWRIGCEKVQLDESAHALFSLS